MTSEGRERAAGDSPDVEPTLSDDADRRAADASVRRSDERVRHSDPAVRARLRRRRRRTNRIYLGIGLGLALLLVGYVALYFLPVLSVRQIEVTGAQTVAVEDVVERSGVALGTPLLQVDTHAVARRIAGMPRVDEVTVRRDHPSTLKVELVEREALVHVEVDGETRLIDPAGVDFGPGEPPPGTPGLVLGDEARDETSRVVQDLAVVFGEIRGTAGQEIASAEVRSPAEIEVTLVDGRRVEWGSAGRDHEKALALAMVLSQEGEVWNVSNPAMPTVR